MDTPNNSNELQKLIEQLKALKTIDWLKVAVILIAALYIGYRCFLPWRAEYAYREAFNAEAQGNIPYAIEKYQKAMRLAPWETYYHIQLGKNYENLARATQNVEERLKWTKSAEDIYKYVLVISPKNPWYVNRMAEVYDLYASVEPDPKKAEELRRKRDEQIVAASRLDPNNALFQLSVAYLYHQKKDFATALKKYEHVLEIDDTMGEAYFNMADIYRQQNNLPKQIEMYQRIIEKKPDFKNAHLQLGRIYESQGKLQEAIKEYIEEVKLDKNNSSAFQVLGLAFFRNSDWENMVKVYNRLNVLEPNNANYYLYKAQAYVRLNNWTDAVAAMEAAEVLNPNDPNIKANLKNLRKMKNPQAAPVAQQNPAAQPPAETPQEATVSP